MPTVVAQGQEEEMFVATIVSRESAEETAMATEVAPEPEEKPVVFLDSVMLDRFGRTYSHADLDAAREAALNKKGAVDVVTTTGHTCCLSVALSDRPEGISYLDLEWPREGSVEPVDPYSLPAYLYVRAIDEDLVLFDISIPSQLYYMPPDLFVYKAGPTPSAQPLPLYTERRSRPFLMSRSTTGILRLPDDGYIVSDLWAYREKKEGTDDYSVLFDLCVFNSKTKEWKLFLEMPAPQLEDQSNPQFPIRWSCDEVHAFSRRFICCVDYFSGILLCDFSNFESPVLHFVRLPGGEEYADNVRVSRCSALRYRRRVSVSQGMMHFVRIDGWRPRLERCECQKQPPQKITIWTLNNLDGDKFKWETHRVINLDFLRPLCDNLGIPQSLPEFPVICATDPDNLCCLLRDEELSRDELSRELWIIMVDMNRAVLQTYTKYVNQQPYDAACVNEKAKKVHRDFFSEVPPLPTVFSKYLARPTVVPRGNKKHATIPFKKIRLTTSADGMM